jgi:L-threonylcarbamoyladenylate synthase
MSAERIVLSNGFSRDRVIELSQRIKDGAVFIYPTETIYGIGGLERPEIDTRIRRIKQRPLDAPMILLAHSTAVVESSVVILSPIAKQLAEFFWPGALTIVIPRQNGMSVGVRVSDIFFISLIGPAINEPIFSTSANYSGETYNDDPDAIFDLFKNDIDFMIDAGRLPVSLPSTVIRPEADGSVTILREGAISRSVLSAACASFKCIVK